MRRNYQQKVVWITGASEGIGRALAKVFAQEGARLILSSRREDKLKLVAESCLAQGAIAAHHIAFDLEDDLALDAACKKAQSLFGSIDVLVLNAGLSQRAFAAETTVNTFRRLMNVNYLANVRITLNLLKGLLKAKSQIVVISSLVGKFGSPYRSGYAASKHALHGFYDSLRAEHIDALAVSIICPGFIKTDLSLHALKGDGQALNIMDDAQASGMLAEVFVNRAIKGISLGKAEMYIGGKERMGVYLKRFFPGLFRKLISKAKVR